MSIKKTNVFTALLLLICALIILPVKAYAQCIGGIPCVVDKTDDPDHFDNVVEPNISGNPNASKSDSDTCDADFMNQIYSRALLEAERENVMSQVVLRKSDSVLDYSCFEDVINNTGSSAGGLFSDTEGNLDSELQGLVISALNNYNSFNYHSFLGGVSPAAPLEPGCPRMNAIYNLAKCTDFAVDDVFLLFSSLATPTDPRSLPTACAAGTTQITTGFVNVAENNAFTHVSFDDMNYNYLDRMDPTNCGMPAIPTGVMIRLEEKYISHFTGKVTIIGTTIYQEHVCSNPSCYYDQASSSCQ